MIVWNARHGWPTLAHTLGHLGVGGDQEAPEGHFTPLWFLSLVGAQLGAVGPGALALMALATTAVLRNRRHKPQTDARFWMICCAMPSLAFFVGLSFFKSVLGGWPFPSYVTLVVLVGAWGAELAATATARPFNGWWRVAMVYGAVGTLLLYFPNPLTRVPLLGK